MKLSLRFALAVLVMLVWPAAAATQTIILSPGKNFTGLHVAEPALQVGSVTSVSVLTTGLIAVNVTPAVPLHAHHQWSFESVDQPGIHSVMWSRVVTWDAGGGRIVVRDPGAACRPVAGQGCKIRPVRTVASLFAAPLIGALQKGDAATADLIHLPNGTGYTTLYCRDGFLAGWRAVGEVGDKSDVPVFLIQGIIIERRGPTPLMLMLTGEAMTSAVTVSLSDPLVNAQGYAHLSTIFGGIDDPAPVPAKSLYTSGLSIADTALPPCWSIVRPGISMSAADNVLFTLPTPVTPFFSSERFYFDDGPQCWFDALGMDPGGRPLPAAILIHRRLAASYSIRFVP